MLSAWRRRFPDRDFAIRRIRLWCVELAVRGPSPLAEWVRKATADGDSIETAADRLGLPPGLIREIVRPVRRTFAFIDLPTGPHPVPVPPTTFAPWPDPVTSIPADVLRPPGVDVVPITDDWRTIPVVRAEAIDVVAVKKGEAIDVYAADDPEGSPLWHVPADRWT
jgi:hypothetical protein